MVESVISWKLLRYTKKLLTRTFLYCFLSHPRDESRTASNVYPPSRPGRPSSPSGLGIFGGTGADGIAFGSLTAVGSAATGTGSATVTALAWRAFNPTARPPRDERSSLSELSAEPILQADGRRRREVVPEGGGRRLEEAEPSISHIPWEGRLLKVARSFVREQQASGTVSHGIGRE